MNKYDARLAKLMSAWLVVVACGTLLIKLFGEARLVRIFYSLAPLAALAFMIFMGLVVVFGIQSLGFGQGKTNFGSQVFYVMKKITLWLLLPAAIITFVLTIVAWLMGNLSGGS